MTTLDTLRRLLTEATPGPWKVSQDGLTHPEGWDLIGPDDEAIAIDPEGYTGAIYYHANARLIAAAPTHLADLITALEREAKVRELHAKGTFVFSWHTGLRFEPACPTCDGKAGAHECGCWADSDETDWYCKSCGPKSHYPCPTIRILDEEGK